MRETLSLSLSLILSLSLSFSLSLSLSLSLSFSLSLSLWQAIVNEAFNFPSKCLDDLLTIDNSFFWTNG